MNNRKCDKHENDMYKNDKWENENMICMKMINRKTDYVTNRKE